MPEFDVDLEEILENLGLTTGVKVFPKDVPGLNAIVSKSDRFSIWVTMFTPHTCLYCVAKDGIIIDTFDLSVDLPPVHEYCNCLLEEIGAIIAGTATI